MSANSATERALRGITRRCRAASDLATLEADVLRALRRAMPIDAAFFATADPQTLMFTGILAEEPLASATPLFLDNELAGTDVNQFTALARSSRHVATLDAATGDDRSASARYRDVMRPIGLGDELRAALVSNAQCWGYLCLHREDGASGFTSTETALVGQLGPHIATAVKYAILARDSHTHSAPRGGVVILDDALDLVASTGEADELLSMLDAAGAKNQPLPWIVCAVAAALKQAERRDAPTMPPSAHVRNRAGQWLDVHAARLNGVENRIAVVIEPAAALSTVQIMLSAYGLSPREREIATHVLRGESTRQICDAMHISTHTVQDHLKQVFDKIGVRSRRDLVARLHGH